MRQKLIVSLFCLICLLFFISFLGCKDDVIHDIEDNYDIEMYVNDSIDLIKYKITFSDKSKLTEKSTLFGIKDGKLYVSDLRNVKQNTIYSIFVDNIKLEVKVKFWIENKYKLELIDEDCKYRVLLTKADTTFFIQNDQLFYSVGNMSNKTFCAKLPLYTNLYTEFVAENGYYAYRSYLELYVSKDLKNWKKIYSGKRGIKSSMVIVPEKKRLLFIEYTEGKMRDKHSIYSYNYENGVLEKKYTFGATTDNQSSTYKVRHIHVIQRDPYNGDIYVGTGDDDSESFILRSTDSGDSFYVLGQGSQLWRTLAFIFTPTHIFWNVDSDQPQFLTRVSKADLLKNTQIDEKKLIRYPLTNSALWCTMDYSLTDKESMTIMSSNSEGAIYDNYCRTYGILIEDQIPKVYELYKIPANMKYTQLFVLGVDNESNLYFCNVESMKISSFKMRVN